MYVDSNYIDTIRVDGSRPVYARHITRYSIATYQPATCSTSSRAEKLHYICTRGATPWWLVIDPCDLVWTRCMRFAWIGVLTIHPHFVIVQVPPESCAHACRSLYRPSPLLSDSLPCPTSMPVPEPQPATSCRRAGRKIEGGKGTDN